MAMTRGSSRGAGFDPLSSSVASSPMDGARIVCSAARGRALAGFASVTTGADGVEEASVAATASPADAAPRSAAAGVGVSRWAGSAGGDVAASVAGGGVGSASVAGGGAGAAVVGPTDPSGAACCGPGAGGGGVVSADGGPAAGGGAGAAVVVPSSALGRD